MLKHNLLSPREARRYAEREGVPGRVEGRMARLISIGMTLALLLFLPGCGGCRQTPPKDKTAEEVEKERLELEKRELERAKPDFEAKFLVSRPLDRLDGGKLLV